MSDNKNPFLEMAKAISCLRLELPESVWKDVADRWMAVVKVINTQSPVPDKVEINEIVLEAMDFYWRALTDKLNGKDLGDIERKNYEVLTAKLYKLLKQ